MTATLVRVERNLDAEARYRAAWSTYVLSTDAVEKHALEELMDSLQPEIANNPKDPRWVAFADSLPGYRDFWERFGRESMEAIEAHIERKRAAR